MQNKTNDKLEQIIQNLNQNDNDKKINKTDESDVDSYSECSEEDNYFKRKKSSEKEVKNNKNKKRKKYKKT